MWTKPPKKDHESRVDMFGNNANILQRRIWTKPPKKRTTSDIRRVMMYGMALSSVSLLVFSPPLCKYFFLSHLPSDTEKCTPFCEIQSVF